MATIDKELDRLEATANKMLAVIAKIRGAEAPAPRKRQAKDPSKPPGRRGRPSRLDAARNKLGPAEQNVFDGLRRGLTPAEIAEQAQRSISTIRNQTGRIYKALEVNSRAELIARFPSDE